MKIICWASCSDRVNGKVFVEVVTERERSDHSFILTLQEAVELQEQLDKAVEILTNEIGETLP